VKNMVSEKRALVQIKGVRDGLLVTLGEGDWPELRAALFTQIVERESFFKGAKVTLDVGNQILHAAEMGSLRDKLSEKGISLWAVLSNSPTTEQTAQMLGLATRISKPRPERSIHTLDTNLTSGDNAMFVQRTLRSGFRISYQGHVVVLGDVNPGAEIVASGNILVWGRLRGQVHAGAEGNENAIVCSLDLEPTQLRIADLVATAPTKKSKPQPEMACIKNGQVVAEPWNTKER
jgi:septum site-determining protein MinC